MVLVLKAIRWPLAGVYWSTILIHGLAARALATVDVAIDVRTRPLFPPRGSPRRDARRPNLRVVK